MAENQNIRSSRGAAEYSLTFEMVLPGGRVQFCFSNSPAGRLGPIDKPAKADRSGDRTRPLLYIVTSVCCRFSTPTSTGTAWTGDFWSKGVLLKLQYRRTPFLGRF